MDKLPDYVVLNDENCKMREILTQPAKTLTFPLSEEDQKDIAILEAKYDQEGNCAGLAAPQIGIHKRIIVFAVEPSEELKKWRPDLSDTMPKTIWINPTFKPLSEEMHSDYEGCFSVDDMVGEVPRYTTIHYEAFTPSGEKVEGTARGFLARLIQHEIDHTMGYCFVHRTDKANVMSREDYHALREKAMKDGGR